MAQYVTTYDKIKKEIKNGAGIIIDDNDDIDCNVDILNGIWGAVAAGMYTQGHRNNIAVDLCISCWLTGNDPKFVSYAMENAGYITMEDGMDLRDRIDTINEYKMKWSPTLSYYYIDESEWQSWNNNSESKYLVVID